jgi:multidrug efflux pump subunit AcrA (membrane-fusion protein)
MCPPIIAVGLGIAQAGMQIQGQRQQAKTQAKVQKNASAAERQRYLQEVSSMRIQQGQEQVAAAQRIQESTRKAREARSTARVSAGEAGVAGLSVDALINDLTREEASYNFATQQQTQMNDVNRTIQLDQAGLGFTNNMLRINRPIEQPNYLGAALGGAQTGLSTYDVTKDF